MITEDELAAVPEAPPRAAAPGEQVGEALPLYLQEIGRVSLLSGPQEVELAMAIESGNLSKERVDALKESGDFTDDEIDQLNEAILAGAAARRRLIESNLRLVVSVARRYMNRGLPLSDL